LGGLPGQEIPVEIDGKKCDVYATAVLYAEILQPHSSIMQGMLPFAMIVAVVQENYRPPLAMTLPPQTVTLVRKMWDTDPHLRPSFTEVLEALLRNQRDVEVKGKLNKISTKLKGQSQAEGAPGKAKDHPRCNAGPGPPSSTEPKNGEEKNSASLSLGIDGCDSANKEWSFSNAAINHHERNNSGLSMSFSIDRAVSTTEEERVV
jgi:hypothetical protein